MPALRIATANLENLDDIGGEKPPLAVRVPFLRAELVRLRADVLLPAGDPWQDVPGGARQLAAVNAVIDDSRCGGYQSATTVTEGGELGAADRRRVARVHLPLVLGRKSR